MLPQGVLQRRADAAGLPVSVVDAGISGNRLLTGGLIPQFGPSAADRVDADVIAQAGVTDVVLAEGVNDLSMPVSADFDPMVDGYTRIITLLHAAGLRVHLATLPPGHNPVLAAIPGPSREPDRQRINAWIRSQQLSDSVVDIDAALRDPADPTVLDVRYAAPDGVHFSPAGYAREAAAVNLDTLSP